jgi:hypothetical protein
MKLFLIACFFSSTVLTARNIVVFSKGDTLALESGTVPDGPGSPEKAAFLSAFRADAACPQPFAAPLELSDLPQWGRKVPGATGSIQFHESFRGGFVVRVALEGLAPDHPYILTLNGNPERAGNNHLADPVPGNERERYLDFITITADSKGRFGASFGIRLPTGRYDVRFYVKDTSDFKIVLYRDFFKFSVE